MLKQTFVLGSASLNLFGNAVGFASRKGSSNLDLLGDATDYSSYKKIFSRLDDDEVEQLARMAESGLLSVSHRRRMKQLIEEHKFLLTPRAMRGQIATERRVS
ncbi:MAG: hypothetical protein HQL64_04715 [Magnetococcales bacterium]|nr:hypothetical protein [Magnetococcales bacterium]